MSVENRFWHYLSIEKGTLYTFVKAGVTFGMRISWQKFMVHTEMTVCSENVTKMIQKCVHDPKNC